MKDLMKDLIKNLIERLKRDFRHIICAIAVKWKCRVDVLHLNSALLRTRPMINKNVVNASSPT
jgi:hypothetical protein